MKSLLIANRGEIAVRIARSAAEMGLETVAVFAEDDGASLHTRTADRAVALAGSGPAVGTGTAWLVKMYDATAMVQSTLEGVSAGQLPVYTWAGSIPVPAGGT